MYKHVIYKYDNQTNFEVCFINLENINTVTDSTCANHPPQPNNKHKTHITIQPPPPSLRCDEWWRSIPIILTDFFRTDRPEVRSKVHESKSACNRVQLSCDRGTGTDPATLLLLSFLISSDVIWLHRPAEKLMSSDVILLHCPTEQLMSSGFHLVTLSRKATNVLGCRLATLSRRATNVLGTNVLGCRFATLSRRTTNVLGCHLATLSHRTTNVLRM